MNPFKIPKVVACLNVDALQPSFRVEVLSQRFGVADLSRATALVSLCGVLPLVGKPATAATTVKSSSSVSVPLGPEPAPAAPVSLAVVVAKTLGLAGGLFKIGVWLATVVPELPGAAKPGASAGLPRCRGE